ncbi:hypothetical protein [Streptomyces oceani]|uniref:Hydrogenase expression protein HypF n=1 Tax=Streptomyces oceani TaxID=1075402 RepID=A0A1E7KNW8_9ACTN|nr:hypothetical protein [Streptomyces oceani]OEV05679.1 hypothetical protein AN216_01540 [Streptomyces oceani]
MPGDEAREETGTVADATADTGRARTGPRHAAPRKPLLTRLHLPAGKAIAMAAMPSAVLMGMGLTPQLASAKPQPKNPFKDGPCVSAPDKEEEARADAAEKAKENSQKQAEEAEEAKEKAERQAEKRKAAAERAEKEKAEKEKADEADPAPEESPSGTDGSDSAEDSGSPAEPEPEPSESESKNPLDPLGVGEKLKDLLTPGEKNEQEDDESATPTPEPSDPGTGGSDKPQSPGDDADKPGDGKSDEDGTGERGDGTDGSAPGEQPEPTPSESEAEKGQDEPEADAGADEDGKKPFPCVEEKKVDGEDEKTPVTLPNQPWELQASKLALHGLDYEGVVNVRTADGGSKQALKFTADSVDIDDLHQIVGGPNGTRYHVRAAEGSTSTIRNGQVTMYTERLEGNLFGIIPIVFDPEHPPPLNVPEAMFTDVKVQQAGQFGGTLSIPGLQQEITQ